MLPLNSHDLLSNLIPPSVPWLCVLLSLFFALNRFVLTYYSSNTKCPPGPTPWPLLGNILILFRKKPWQAFTALYREYGDVVYLTMLGTPVIVLNSVEAVNDLFESRSGIYSDRPVLPLMSLIGHDKWSFPFMPYGKHFRSMRRPFLGQYSSPASLRSFYDAQRGVTVKFLRSVLYNPANVVRHIRLRASQLILDVTYGITVDSDDDPFVRTADAVMATASLALSPALWLINPTTILKYLPGWFGGSATLRRWRADCDALRHLPYAHVQLALAQGLAKPSYVANLIEEISPKPGSEEETIIRDTAATAYGGPSVSFSLTSSEVFLLAMVRYPQVQERAQEELDRVVGTHRLPDYVDKGQLPYISAIVKEVLRWHPPGPTGVPHRLTQDDVYRGYHMPAGAMVVGNIWGLLHDPKMYPDPMEFRPERFLRNGIFDCSTNDPSRYAFGFGRRMCPGKMFAEDSIWLFVAQFLAVFTVVHPEGTAPPPAEFASEAFSRPLPFKCDIRPRSQVAIELVEGAVAARD
ncbi:cytochrome P450 [Daedaleopsis nitida]|nr:cytochrome P450 [Daedaleopsis nitida]